MESIVNFESIVNEMLSSGYHKFKPNKITAPHATLAYQKRYRDEVGTKFFITCYEYDYENLFDHGRPYPKSWEFDGQFELKDGRSFNFCTVGWYFYETEWGHKPNKLKDVEEFFHKLWTSMECKHYEKKENE